MLLELQHRVSRLGCGLPVARDCQLPSESRESIGESTTAAARDRGEDDGKEQQQGGRGEGREPTPE